MNGPSRGRVEIAIKRSKKLNARWRAMLSDEMLGMIVEDHIAGEDYSPEACADYITYLERLDKRESDER